MKIIIIIVLSLFLCGYTTWANTTFKNGYCVFHEDIAWSENSSNMYNYPKDDKYHVYECEWCGFGYLFYSYPKSTCFEICPNSNLDWISPLPPHSYKNKMREIGAFNSKKEVAKFYRNRPPKDEIYHTKYGEVI